MAATSVAGVKSATAQARHQIRRSHSGAGVPSWKLSKQNQIHNYASENAGYGRLCLSQNVQRSKGEVVIGSYVDEPLMMKAGGQNYYYATNRLYSVAAISDQAGAVVERYKYDAYGKQGILAPNGVIAYKPSDYGQFHGFTGRYHDWETNLTYFRARYFDHNLGRFIGRDPWKDKFPPSAKDGYKNSLSLYCAQFIPNYVDPSGMITEFWFNVISDQIGYPDWIHENYYVNAGYNINIPSVLPSNYTNSADYLGGRLNNIVNWFGGPGAACIKEIRLAGHGAGAGITTSNGSISNNSPPDTIEKIRSLMCPDAILKIDACNAGQWPAAVQEIGRRFGVSKVCSCAGNTRGGQCDTGWQCTAIAR
jgi:RHS repeat-associated protein